MNERTPIRVGIIGASGFTGAELLRLIAGHPELELVVATGDSQAGTAVADLYPSLAGAYPDLVFAAATNTHTHRSDSCSGSARQAAIGFGDETDLEDACALAEDFGQMAIVYGGTDGIPGLVWIEPTEEKNEQKNRPF